MFLQRTEQRPGGLLAGRSILRPRDVAQQTLRLLVLAPIVLLALVMVLAAGTGIVENSISAYHGGPFRDVLVGSLLATAVGLVSYLGANYLEDFAFTVAGFFAVFVAFVPFDIKTQILSTPEGVLDARGVVKLTLVGFLVTVAGFIAVDRSRGRWSVGELMERPAERFFAWLSIASLVGYAAWVIGCLADPYTTFPGVHLGAAVLVFVHLWIAVVSHAWLRCPPVAQVPRVGGMLQIAYRVIAITMVVAAVAAGALALGGQAPAQLVLDIELAEIALFALFWTCERVRFWNIAGHTRNGPKPAEASAD